MNVAVFVVAFTLGTVAAVAPIGPVTILVVRRGLQLDWRGALRTGLGRVPPETIYCGLATFGMAALLEEFPGAMLTIEMIGTGLLFVLGIWFAARDHAPPTDDEDLPASKRGDWAGLIISALNPTLLLSWSAIAAIAISFSRIEPTTLHKLLFPLGVGSGIACGYVGLIWTMRRFAGQLDPALVSYGIRAIGVAFVAMSVWSSLKLTGVF